MEEIKKIIDIFFESSIYDITVAIIIIAIFMLIDKLILNKILKIIDSLVRKTKNNFDNIISTAVSKPISKFIVYLGFYYSVYYLSKVNNNEGIIDINNKVLKAVIILLITWFLYNLTLDKSFLYERLKCKCDIKSNKILFPFISAIVRIVVLVVAISIIAKEFGFSGFITGLGISGVVCALAAQDTLSNLLGGMIIVFDRPFTIGDWIETDNIEGVVEEITFRSTRIRTFAKALTIVPNSKLATCNIINWSKREERRIILRIPIDNRTKSSHIRKVISEIELSLIENERVSNESLIVNLDSMKVGYNEIFIYCYVPGKDYMEYKKMKEEVNFIILTILEENNIELGVSINHLYIK